MPRKSSVVVVGLLMAVVLAVLWTSRVMREPAEPRVEARTAMAQSVSAGELAPARAPHREDGARAAVPAVPPAVPPSAAAPGQLDELAVCVLSTTSASGAPSSMEEIRACLAGHDLAAVTAPALASWLCSQDTPSLGRQVLIEQISVTRSPGEFLRFVDELQGEICDSLRESLPLQAGLHWAQQNDPAWWAEVVALIDGQALFGGLSDGVVLLAESLVGDGDERILGLFAAGARGELGGTPQQMTRAASVVAVHEGAGERYLAFCASLLDSPATTPDELMGGHLANFLMRGKARLDGGWERSAALLERLLDDPRFAVEAAAQLLAQHTSQPQGMPDATWEQLRVRARIRLEH
ncbi:MAG: hypothetical protein EXS08_12105 [Planctomycetes bacterium]|nr:hypothetical protein [Planctomycetota bacterium]